MRRAAAGAAAAIGAETIPELLDALSRPAARDAALDALARLDLGDHRGDVDVLDDGVDR